MLTNASKLWHCSYDVPWPKCVRHRKPAAKQHVVPMHKRRKQALLRKFGTDKPPPRRKWGDEGAPNRRPPRRIDGTDQTDGNDEMTSTATKPTEPTRKRCHEGLGTDFPVARVKMAYPEEAHDSDLVHDGRRIESVPKPISGSQHAQ